MENVSPTRSNGKFDRILEIVLSNLNSIGSVWIFVLTILINADAFGRKLFHSPIDGVNEIVELSIVGIVFLQLGDATRKGRLPRSDGLFNFIGRRWPNFGRFHGALFDLLGAVFMGLILYGSIPLFIESYQSDFYIGVEGLFTAPVWPIKLIIVIGCAVTVLQFLVFVRRNLTRTKIEPTDASAID
jgi:TRAP-type C4-dicarboxylate transport system permease small subunit